MRTKLSPVFVKTEYSCIVPQFWDQFGSKVLSSGITVAYWPHALYMSTTLAWFFRIKYFLKHILFSTELYLKKIYYLYYYYYSGLFAFSGYRMALHTFQQQYSEQASKYVFKINKSFWLIQNFTLQKESKTIRI